jgi:hypothetical protein
MASIPTQKQNVSSAGEGGVTSEYVFEVKLRAVVRVRADNEGVAREVVPSVLGPPDSLEIGLANQNNAAVGCSATVTEVDFAQEDDPRQLDVGQQPSRAEARS